MRINEKLSIDQRHLEYITAGQLYPMWDRDGHNSQDVNNEIHHKAFACVVTIDFWTPFPIDNSDPGLSLDICFMVNLQIYT